MIKEFHPADIEAILASGVREQITMAADPSVYAIAYAKAGPAYSWPADGLAKGAIGIIPQEPGVWNVWALVGNDVGGRVLIEVRDVLLGWTMVRLGIRRLQSAVKASNQPARRFAQWFGFREEGILRQYGPDGDYVMVALCLS